MQLEHTEINNLKRLDEVHIICDALTTPENIGMAFRLADAFGVEKIDFIGTEFLDKNRKIRRTARGTEAFIAYENHTELNFLDKKKKEGFRLIGLEITRSSKNIQAIDFSKFQKKAIVIGSEKHGIRPQILEKCDFCVHIPMFGKNSSMNVIHALGIALYASAP